MEHEELVSVIVEALERYDIAKKTNDSKVWQYVELLCIIGFLLSIVFIAITKIHIIEIGGIEYTIIEFKTIITKAAEYSIPFGNVYSTLIGSVSIIAFGALLLNGIIRAICDGLQGTRDSYNRLVIYIGIGELILMILQMRR